MDVESVNKKLRKFFEFDEDDLYANDQSRLSQKQEKQLLQWNQALRSGGMLAGGFFAVLALCIGGVVLFALLVAILTKDWTYDRSIGPIIYGSVAFILVGGMGAVILWSTFRPGGAKGRVCRLSGPVSIRVAERTSSSLRGGVSRKYKIHFMKINNVEFELDDDLIGIVHEGDQFSVNYYDYGVDDGRAPLILTMVKL